MANLTLEDLLERKAQAEEDRLHIKAIHSDVLGGELLCKRLPLRSVASILDRLMGGNQTTIDVLEGYQELIYKSCELLQSPKLKEAYNIEGDRYDIVEQIFNGDMGEIDRVGGKILSFYDSTLDIENIKNS